MIASVSVFYVQWKCDGGEDIALIIFRLKRKYYECPICLFAIRGGRADVARAEPNLPVFHASAVPNIKYKNPTILSLL